MEKGEQKGWGDKKKIGEESKNELFPHGYE